MTRPHALHGLWPVRRRRHCYCRRLDRQLHAPARPNYSLGNAGLSKVHSDNSLDAMDALSNNSGNDSHPSRSNSHSDLVALAGEAGDRAPAGSRADVSGVDVPIDLSPDRTRPNPLSMYSGDDDTGGLIGVAGRSGRGGTRLKRSSDGSVGSTGVDDGQGTNARPTPEPVGMDRSGEIRDIRRPNKLYTDDR